MASLGASLDVQVTVMHTVHGVVNLDKQRSCTFGEIRRDFVTQLGLNLDDIFLLLSNYKEPLSDERRLDELPHLDGEEVVLTARTKCRVSVAVRQRRVDLMLTWPTTAAVVKAELCRACEWNGSLQLLADGRVLEDDETLSQKQLERRQFRAVLGREIAVRMDADTQRYRFSTHRRLTDFRDCLPVEVNADDFFFVDAAGRALDECQLVDELLDESADELWVGMRRKTRVAVEERRGAELVRTHRLRVHPSWTLQQLADECQLRGPVVFLRRERLGGERRLQELAVQEEDVFQAFRVFDVQLQVDTDERSITGTFSNALTADQLLHRLSLPVSSLLLFEGRPLSLGLLNLPCADGALCLRLRSADCRLQTRLAHLDKVEDAVCHFPLLSTPLQCRALIDSAFRLNTSGRLAWTFGQQRLHDERTLLEQGVDDTAPGASLLLSVYFPLRARLVHRGETTELGVDSCATVHSLLTLWLKGRTHTDPASFVVKQEGRLLPLDSTLASLLPDLADGKQLLLTVDSKEKLFFRFAEHTLHLDVSTAATPAELDAEMRRGFMPASLPVLGLTYALQEAAGPRGLDRERTLASQGVSAEATVVVDVVYPVRVAVHGLDTQLPCRSDDTVRELRQRIAASGHRVPALSDRERRHVGEETRLSQLLPFVHSASTLQLTVGRKERVTFHVDGGRPVTLSLPLDATPRQLHALLAGHFGVATERPFRLRHEGWAMSWESSFGDQAVSEGAEVCVDLSLPVHVANAWGEAADVSHHFLDERVDQVDWRPLFLDGRRLAGDLSLSVACRLSSVTAASPALRLQAEERRGGVLPTPHRLLEYSGRSQEQLVTARQERLTAAERRRARRLHDVVLRAAASPPPAPGPALHQVDLPTLTVRALVRGPPLLCHVLTLRRPATVRDLMQLVAQRHQHVCFPAERGRPLSEETALHDGQVVELLPCPIVRVDGHAVQLPAASVEWREAARLIAAAANTPLRQVLQWEVECERCHRRIVEETQRLPSDCCSLRSTVMRRRDGRDVGAQMETRAVLSEEEAPCSVTLASTHDVARANPDAVWTLSLDTDRPRVSELRGRAAELCRLPAEMLLLVREESAREGARLTAAVARGADGPRCCFVDGGGRRVERAALASIRRVFLQDEETAELRRGVANLLVYSAGQQCRVWINSEETEEVRTFFLHLPAPATMRQLRDVLERLTGAPQHRLGRRQARVDGRLVTEGAYRDKSELVFLPFARVWREGEWAEQSMDWEQVGGRPALTCVADEEEAPLLIGYINVFTYQRAGGDAAEAGNGQPAASAGPPAREQPLSCKAEVLLQFYNRPEDNIRPLNSQRRLDMGEIRLPATVHSFHRRLADKLKRDEGSFRLSRRERRVDGECPLQECRSSTDVENVFFPSNRYTPYQTWEASGSKRRAKPRELRAEEPLVLAPASTNVFIVTCFDPRRLAEVVNLWRIRVEKAPPDYLYAALQPDDLGCIHALQLRDSLASHYNCPADSLLLSRRRAEPPGHSQPFYEAFCEDRGVFLMVSPDAAIQRTGDANAPLTPLQDDDLLVLSPEHANVVHVQFR